MRYCLIAGPLFIGAVTASWVMAANPSLLRNGVKIIRAHLP